MQVKTFRARSLAEALTTAWREMGPDARVLETARQPHNLWDRLLGREWVEVTAMEPIEMSLDASGADDGNAHPMTSGIASAPRTQQTLPTSVSQGAWKSHAEPLSQVPHSRFHCATATRPLESPHRLRQFADDDSPGSVLEEIVQRQASRHSRPLPSSLFGLYSDLVEADVDEPFARAIVEELGEELPSAELASARRVREYTLQLLLQRIRVSSPIDPGRLGESPGKRRVVALVGPTGVGKTTTVAKIAANLRLRDRCRVGLITVDTYRIAAVDQLRAYADIIDLPMEVVTTPREMRAAVSKLSGQDVVLIDTAGRSPQDELQLQELKAMLHEAQADETHLVLSSVGHGRHLLRLVEHFRAARPTSLLLTKLDEGQGSGNLLSLVCQAGLPLSYTTHGQNVPDDIQPADPVRLIEPLLQVTTRRFG